MHVALLSIFPTWQDTPQTYVLLIALLAGSVAGFYSKRFYQALIFHPYEVFRGRRIHTLLTSALIHRNWRHLLFNIIVIFLMSYDMGYVIQQEYTSLHYLVILVPFMLSSIILMNLLIGYLNRNNFEYTYVGASGLTFSFIGISLAYFPTDTVGKSYFLHQVLGLKYAYQCWIIIFVFLFILVFIGKKSTNHRLHLYAYLYGTLMAMVLNQNFFEAVQDIFN